MVVGVRQNFQSYRHNTSFLENKRAVSKFLYRILYYLISITKLQKIKNQSTKHFFKFNVIQFYFC